MIGMVLVFSNFARLFSESGFGAALIQKANIEKRHLNAVFLINIFVGILLTFIFIVAAPLIASFYQEPYLKMLTIVMALNFFLSSGF